MQELRTHFEALRQGIYAAEASRPKPNPNRSASPNRESEGVCAAEAVATPPGGPAADRGREQLLVDPLQRGLSKEWY